MFHPMVSASPPASDNEVSGDETDHFGADNSAFDITGLSQKLPACQLKNNTSEATVARDLGPPAVALPSEQPVGASHQPTGFTQLPSELSRGHGGEDHFARVAVQLALGADLVSNCGGDRPLSEHPLAELASAGSTEPDEPADRTAECALTTAGDSDADNDEFDQFFADGEMGECDVSGARTEPVSYCNWSAAAAAAAVVRPPGPHDVSMPSDRPPLPAVTGTVAEDADFPTSVGSVGDCVRDGNATPYAEAEHVPSSHGIGLCMIPGAIDAPNCDPSHRVSGSPTISSDEDQTILSHDLQKHASSTLDSTSRVEVPDEFGDFAAPSDSTELAVASANSFGDCSSRSSDCGIPATTTDEFDKSTALAGEQIDPAAIVDGFADVANLPDDFGEFSVGAGTDNTCLPDGVGSDGTVEFADFGAAFSVPVDIDVSRVSPQLAGPADCGDDDFGEFEVFQASCPQEAFTTVKEEAVSLLLDRLFPLMSGTGEATSPPLDVSEVWHQLRVPDCTAALRYRWSGSRANAELLRALRVDVNNIVNFACWGSRLDQTANCLDSELVLPTIWSPPGRSPQQQQQQQQSLFQVSLATNEVPPVAFDWNSSGLKNPLESSGLEQELAAAEEAVPPAAASMYSRLLVQTARPPLTDSAVSVLARIPNIDFMQAKVLMFPVRGD